MMIRDRIKEFRRVPASELRPSARNWRTHPQQQKEALQGILAEIGYADALLARELPDGTLELVDGHLRAETTPEQQVPVLVLDLTEDEAAKLLLTLDPLAAMATADAGKLDALLREVQTGSQELANMLAKLAADNGVIPKRLPTDPANDPAEEWEGMPEFQHEDLTSQFRAIVHFASEADMLAFEKLVGQTIPKNTQAIWYPKAERQVVKGTGYVSDGA